MVLRGLKTISFELKQRQPVHLIIPTDHQGE